MSARIRVVLADDHALLRDGLRALLARAEDIEVVGEASDGREAIAVCERLSPDVIVLDIAMPGLGGLEAATEIRKSQPSVKVLVLTQYEDREYVRRFLKIGISGYVLKRAAASDLTSAIRSASRGGLVLDPAIARDALVESEGPSVSEDPYELLTDREKQVLRLVAEGRSNKEVASLLGISLKTSMTHREHLMLKLGLHNRTDLVRFALRKGVLPA
ncbi:MAG: response regulator transcription factor [Acidobacteria bacterium]|nr:response regulator transcription factor [Acidobacteriota bacterium]